MCPKSVCSLVSALGQQCYLAFVLNVLALLKHWLLASSITQEQKTVTMQTALWFSAVSFIFAWRPTGGTLNNFFF